MPNKEQPRPDVQIGQIWQDWDARYRPNGRKIKITRIDGSFAYATVINDSKWRERGVTKSTTGDTTRIHISRMRPTSNGYRLEED